MGEVLGGGSGGAHLRVLTPLGQEVRNQVGIAALHLRDHLQVWYEV